MRVWESYAMLAPDQYQEIGVSLLKITPPCQHVEPYFTLTFPDGQEKSYYHVPERRGWRQHDDARPDRSAEWISDLISSLYS